MFKTKHCLYLITLIVRRAKERWTNMKYTNGRVNFLKPNINGIAIHLIPGARGAHLSKNWTVDTNSYVYILFEIQEVT